MMRFIDRIAPRPTRPPTSSFMNLVARYLFTGFAAFVFLAGLNMLIMGGFRSVPEMLAGPDKHTASLRALASCAGYAVCYTVWLIPFRLRGWRNVAIGILSLIGFYIATDLIFGGPLASGGDISKIGHPPVLSLLERYI